MYGFQGQKRKQCWDKEMVSEQRSNSDSARQLWYKNESEGRVVKSFANTLERSKVMTQESHPVASSTSGPG